LRITFAKILANDRKRSATAFLRAARAFYEAFTPVSTGDNL